MADREAGDDVLAEDAALAIQLDSEIHAVQDKSAKTTDPKRVVERGYDQVAYEYARLEGRVEWPRMRWLSRMLGRLGPGSSVLDLGCGSGEPADIEIAQKHKVEGVIAQWLGAPMYFSCFDSETVKQAVMAEGSVITVDNGIKILAIVAS